MPPVVGAVGDVEELIELRFPDSVLGVEIGVFGPADVDFWVVFASRSLRVSGVGAVRLLGPSKCSVSFVDIISSYAFSLTSKCFE